jgi:hypothetical protein
VGIWLCGSSLGMLGRGTVLSLQPPEGPGDQVTVQFPSPQPLFSPRLPS